MFNMFNSFLLIYQNVWTCNMWFSTAVGFDEFLSLGVAFCQSVSDVSWGCENPDLSWWAEGVGWVYNWHYAVFTGLVLWHLHIQDHIQVFPKMGTTETIGFAINDDKFWMMFGYLTSGHPRSKNSHYFRDSKMDFLGPSVHRHFMIPHTASKKVKGGWLKNPHLVHLVRWFSHVFLPMKSVGISPSLPFLRTSHWGSPRRRPPRLRPFWLAVCVAACVAWALAFYRDVLNDVCGIIEWQKSCLVGGLEHEFYFSIYWEFHHPNWLSYFSAG